MAESEQRVAKGRRQGTWKLLPKAWWRRVVLSLVVILFLLFLPYVFSRIMAPLRCISKHSAAASSGEVPVPAVSNGLRIATYNIAHGRDLVDDNWQGGTREDRLARLNQLAELLRSIDADIVVLNEVDFDCSWSYGVNQAKYLALHAGYANWVEERNLDFRFLTRTWRFGNAILSRFPITEATEISLPGYSCWESLLAGKKRGVRCVVDTGKTNLVVIGVHLSHRSEAVRVQSARMLTTMVTREIFPTMVAGDMNSTPTGFPTSKQDEHGDNAIEVFDAAGRFQRLPVTQPKEDQMTYRSNKPSRVIDWILVPQAWRFSDYRVFPSELSDHRPVCADIECGIVAGVGQERR